MVGKMVLGREEEGGSEGRVGAVVGSGAVVNVAVDVGDLVASTGCCGSDVSVSKTGAGDLSVSSAGDGG